MPKTLAINHLCESRLNRLVRHKLILALLGGVVFGALLIYWPALGGNYILDDLSLPLSQAANRQPLLTWARGVRPVLIFSYWANGRLLGSTPASYHLINLLIHFVNSALVFLVLQRLLGMAAWERTRRQAAASLGAVVFLIHPLQTESVSYISGRSESLAALFVLLAYTVFLYRRRQAISWLESAAVLILFGLGVATKENAVSLAGILVLTDVMWPQAFSLGGLRRNWRLYLMLVPAGLGAAIAILRMLSHAGTAGFTVGTFTWYQYAFTEARAIFAYLRMVVLPLGQSLDHDFPTSRTVFEHGAILYILLLGGLVAGAVLLRRKFPLSAFGLLMFLIWLAPTSSVIPIDDALVERRMYLPMMGLILIACEGMDRLNLRRPAIFGTATIVVLAMAGFCYERNELWGRPESLLAMAAAESRTNPRPMLNFAEILIKTNQCDLAVPYLVKAQRILPNNYFVKAGWGRTLACLGRGEEALQALQDAARLRSCSQVYEWIGLVYGQMGRLEDARAAIEKAVQLDPKSAEAHGALALWYESVHDLESAELEYQRSLDLDPDAWTVRDALDRVSRAKNNPASTDRPRTGS